MRDFYKVGTEYGLPHEICSEPIKLFHPSQEARAEQVLTALKGLRVCSALALLESCKIALLQSDVSMD